MCTDCNEITIPTGPKGDTGATGPAGTNGTNGAPGDNGQDGTTILNTYNSITGTGTPASLVETTLYTYSVPSNTLNTDGDELEAFLYYTTNPDTSITIRIKLGSKIFTITEAVNKAAVVYKIKICRINATSQLWTLDRVDDTTHAVGATTSTVDLSTILVFEVTAQNTVATANQISLFKSTLYKYSA